MVDKAGRRRSPEDDPECRRSAYDLKMSKLTYAVGDIHGRHDLLIAALTWIAQHAEGRGGSNVIFLGDYIDRGSASREVIEALIQGPSRQADTFTCLVGNHEAMLLDGLHDPNAYRHWLRNGGDSTLRSYGGELPQKHIRWMEALPLIDEDDHRYFVHAGLRPYRPIAEQTRHDLLWIREPFLSADYDFGKHVVHGHTPEENGPDLRPNRSNLDVGAVWTGRLCIGVFDPKTPGGPVEIGLVGSAQPDRRRPR